MESLLLKMLRGYHKKGNISFAMPGHKNGRGINKELKKQFFSYDVTELYDTDSLHKPGKVMREVLKNTAGVFGADESFFLVNGATSGIFTMLMGSTKRGDKVLISRDCHTSVINACIVLGLCPVFINQGIIEKLGVTGRDYSLEISKILKEEEISAIFITSPNYYGFCQDIEKISKISNEHNIPLLVDEAHGAHFSGNKEIFPKSAISLGADMSVMSAHKTLNAPNQTAILHFKSGVIDKERVRKAFNMFQTTSPSYPLIASLDMARIELFEKGKDMWERVHKECANIRKELKDIIISPDREWIKDKDIFDIDECRLIFNLSGYEITGFELAKRLREEYKIDVEMADLNQVVLIPTPSNTKRDFIVLKKAVCEILNNAHRIEKGREILPPDLPKMVLNPDVAFSKPGKWVALTGAKGLVSKGSVVPYPPGIPILLPGEEVTDEVIEYITRLLKMGATVNGLADGKIEVIK